MKWTPARQLVEGSFLLAAERVVKLTKVDYPLPLVRVQIEGVDNFSGERVTAGFGWDEQVATDYTLHAKIEGAGRIEIEPARPPREDEGWTYRHRIYDTEGNLLTEALGPNGPAAEIAPDTRRAAQSLLSFLQAAAEAERYPDSENRDLFPDDVRQWASEHSEEIGMAELELSRTVEKGGEQARGLQQ